jgi:hypothetical protein
MGIHFSTIPTLQAQPLKEEKANIPLGYSGRTALRRKQRVM